MLRPNRCGALLVAGLLSALSDCALAASDVISFQANRTAETVATRDGGSARLINLNPTVSAWYVLYVKGPGAAVETAYHLERPDARSGRLALDAAGLIVNGRPCALFGASSPLREGGAFAPICGGEVYVRGQGRMAISLPTELTPIRSRGSASRPRPPALDPAFASASLAPSGLSIPLADGSSSSMQAGKWYAARDEGGVFVSSFAPGMAERRLLASFPERVSPLTSTEASTPAIFVAFDLGQFEAGWSHGAAKPGLGWSEHHGDLGRPGGPDGFATAAPLKLNGMLNPSYLPRLAATIAGGFDRRDGAFKYAPMRDLNGGSYFGFIENGTVLSHLNPGLATFVAYVDGTVDVVAWSDSMNARLPSIRWARQNVLPLIDQGEPGRFVYNPGVGGWSAALGANGAFITQTPRSGMCLLESGASRFLVYGYFPSANPSGVARGFQALGCRTAMHLDMNAPAKAYMGLFVGARAVETAVSGMSSRNTVGAVNGRSVSGPRSALAPDSDDFFFILRR